MRTISKYKIILVLCSPFLWASFAWADSTFDANIEPLFEACMTRCSRTDTLGNLTREGCIRGCNEIRRTFSLRGKRYHSYASCLKDTQEIELNKDSLISENQEWCVDTYKHPHKRVGCKDAIKTFIDNATFKNICSRPMYAQKTTTTKKSTVVTPIVLAPVIMSQPIAKKCQDSLGDSLSTVTPSFVSQANTSLQSAPTPMALKQSQKLRSDMTPSTQQASTPPIQQASKGPSMQPLSQKTLGTASPKSATSVLLSAPLIKDTPKYNSPKPKSKRSVSRDTSKIVTNKKEATETKAVKKTESLKSFSQLPKDAPMPGNETYPGYVPLSERSQHLEDSSSKGATVAPTITTTEMLKKTQAKNNSVESSAGSSKSFSFQQSQSSNAPAMQKKEEKPYEKMDGKKASNSAVSGDTATSKVAISLPVASQSIQAATKEQSRTRIAEVATDNKAGEALEKQALVVEEENSPRIPSQNASQRIKNAEPSGKNLESSESKDISKTLPEHSSSQDMAKKIKATNSSTPLQAPGSVLPMQEETGQKDIPLHQKTSTGTATNSSSSLGLDQPLPIKMSATVISSPIPSFGVPATTQPSANSSSKTTQATSPSAEQQLSEQNQTATQLKKTTPPPPQPYGLSLPPSAIKAPPAPLP